MDNYERSNGATAVKATTEFDSVNHALERAGTLVERVEALTDRLLGPSPTPPSTGLSGVSPAPSGVLPRMGSSAMYAHHRIGDALSALDRIERALP